MLTPAQQAIIQATLPLLETRGVDLTRHFYARLLRDHPGLAPLFNPAHQASGAQAQALARALLSYARALGRLDSLGPLVAQIVGKHVALQVQPDHYPLVGIALLQSIREVLGAEVASEAVLGAWAAAYGQLANLLMAAEERRYAEQAAAAGGWRGARSFRISRIEPESEDISSFYLEPVDGHPVSHARPGQSLSVSLVVAGLERRRTYSLSAPTDGRRYRISVRQRPDGVVSRFLHGEAYEGMELQVFAPSGDFVLEEGSRPLLLIGAGVGITPLLPMLAAALPSGRPVQVIHCSRHACAQPFSGWLEEQAALHSQVQLTFCYSAPQGTDAQPSRLDGARLRRSLGRQRDVDVYLVGPPVFMAEVRQVLVAEGVPEGRIRQEFFGPTVVPA